MRLLDVRIDDDGDLSIEFGNGSTRAGLVLSRKEEPGWWIASKAGPGGGPSSGPIDAEGLAVIVAWVANGTPGPADALLPEPDCRRCARDLRTPDGLPLTSTRMFVCPTCGNKRCPKATDHDLACTGSNEPGQPGSDYQ